MRRRDFIAGLGGVAAGGAGTAGRAGARNGGPQPSNHDQSGPYGDGDRFEAAAGAELLDQRCDVELDGVHGEVERVGNDLVGGASGEQCQHFASSWGEHHRRLFIFHAVVIERLCPNPNAVSDPAAGPAIG